MTKKIWIILVVCVLCIGTVFGTLSHLKLPEKPQNLNPDHIPGSSIGTVERNRYIRKILKSYVSDKDNGILISQPIRIYSDNQEETDSRSYFIVSDGGTYQCRLVIGYSPENDKYFNSYSHGAEDWFVDILYSGTPFAMVGLSNGLVFVVTEDDVYQYTTALGVDPARYEFPPYELEPARFVPLNPSFEEVH